MLSEFLLQMPISHRNGEDNDNEFYTKHILVILAQNFTPSNPPLILVRGITPGTVRHEEEHWPSQSQGSGLQGEGCPNHIGPSLCLHVSGSMRKKMKTDAFMH